MFQIYLSVLVLYHLTLAIAFLHLGIAIQVSFQKKILGLSDIWALPATRSQETLLCTVRCQRLDGPLGLFSSFFSSAAACQLTHPNRHQSHKGCQLLKEKKKKKTSILYITGKAVLPGRYSIDFYRRYICSFKCVCLNVLIIYRCPLAQ